MIIVINRKMLDFTLFSIFWVKAFFSSFFLFQPKPDSTQLLTFKYMAIIYSELMLNVYMAKVS